MARKNHSSTSNGAFHAFHNAANRFLGWAADLPLVIRVLFFPITLVISVVHVAAVFVRLSLLLITRRIPIPSPPDLTKDDLCRLAQAVRAFRVARPIQSPEFVATTKSADTSAGVLRLIDEAIAVLGAPELDLGKMRRIVLDLLKLHSVHDYDAHSLGNSMHRYLDSLDSTQTQEMAEP